MSAATFNTTRLLPIPTAWNVLGGFLPADPQPPTPSTRSIAPTTPPARPAGRADALDSSRDEAGQTVQAAPSVDPVILGWVRLALRGDQDAFAELVYAHQDAVFNLCYRILNDRGEAEDAAQEAFLRAYLNLSRYDPSRSFKTWVLSIASNHCIDRLRRRRLKYLSIEDDVLPNFTLSSDEPEPEQVAVESETGRAMAALINQLPPDYRAAVVLRYWYDYSYVEIADMLQSTESAIKSRLFRARQMLGDMLDDDDTSPDTSGSGRADDGEAAQQKRPNRNPDSNRRKRE